MYVGGTDANALHHLFAEVIDNSMDEAVAGHATFIEVSLEEAGWLSVVDNGRGMPVDPHPKFPKKSALEVIMTMLHAGGKFDSGPTRRRVVFMASAYRWSTRCPKSLEVEVARGQTLYRQTFERGKPTSRTLYDRRQDPEPPGHQVSLPARSANLRGRRRVLIRRASSRWRARRPICSEASRFDGAARPRSSAKERKSRPKPRSIFPADFRDYLAADIEGQELVADQVFTGRVDKSGKHGSVEWAVCMARGR